MDTLYSRYIILNMGGESGSAELWKDPQQRPAEHTDVIEAIGLSPEDAVDRLLNQQLNWEVQKTNNPQVVHLFHDDGPSGCIFLTVIEQQFVGFYESIPI